jgi:tape measure domain-containing protein
MNGFFPGMVTPGPGGRNPQQAIGGVAMRHNIGNFVGQMGSGIAGGVGIAMQGLQAIVPMVVAGYTAAATAAMTLGGALLYASRQAADFEAYIKSLENLEGSADAAAEQLKRLKEIAKKPSIGFGEATESYIALRNARLTSGFAERTLMAFANANARAGGSKEMFKRIMWAATDIATKGYLQGEELRQFGNARIPVRSMLLERFGTADTRELKARGITGLDVLEGLVEMLEKVKAVEPGARNAWDNLLDSIHYGIVDVGMGVNKTFSKMMQDMSDSVNRSSKGGMWSGLGAALMENMTEILGIGGASTDEILINIYAGIRMVGDTLVMIKEATMKLVDVMMYGAIGSAIRSYYGKGKNDFQTRWEGYVNEGRMYMDLGKTREKKDAEKFAEDTKKKMEEGVTDGLVFDGQEDALNKIEHNTRRTAEIMKMEFDRNQRIIGGGQIGGYGVTPIELSGMKGQNGRGRSKINNLIWELIEAMGSGFYWSSKANGVDDMRAGYGT